MKTYPVWTEVLAKIESISNSGPRGKRPVASDEDSESLNFTVRSSVISLSSLWDESILCLFLLPLNLPEVMSSFFGYSCILTGLLALLALDRVEGKSG